MIATSKPAALAVPDLTQLEDCPITGKRVPRWLARIITRPNDPVQQTLEKVDQQRTVAGQYLRLGCYIVPSLFLGATFFELMGRLWMIPVVMTLVNLWALWQMGRSRYFRELNTALFAADIAVTEFFLWQLGVVVSYAVLMLPLIVISMCYLLSKRATIALSTLAILGHLLLIVAQYRGWIPVSPLLAVVGVSEGEIRNFSLVMMSIVFTSTLLPGTLIGFLYFAGLLRQRELELAYANDLISRYVPWQLVDEIMAGTHDQASVTDRRKITVFFSDIRGFTDTADQMEPEEFAQLLNDYLSEMATIAQQFGGTIDKFVGDAIMIFFGAPTSHGAEQDALQAVRMAVAMQQRMQELEQKWFSEGIQTPFQIRIGINTGVANVGSFGSTGRRDYTAIGNQVNLAARLQALCPPGKIIISHTTWAMVRQEIPVEPAGEATVKGVHYPIKTYLVSP